jgi:hypothetical protein
MKKEDVPKGFHRLRYDEMQQLAREFSVHNLGCGYMREPMYHSIRREVKGLCYLVGGKPKCSRNIPFRIEDCEIYQLWLKQRQGDKSENICNG